MTDKIDQLIKNYFQKRSAGVSGQRDSAVYPDSGILYSYLNDELEDRNLERMVSFLKNNPEAQELVLKARQIMGSESGWENENVPPALVQRAKRLMTAGDAFGTCPHCGKRITPFKKPLSSQRWKNIVWLALGASTFALSFVVHRFFYQFLAATLLFGFKWIVEQRATKTQIMIYKALSEESGSEKHRLHQHSSHL